jgi:hypothetical protein
MRRSLLSMTMLFALLVCAPAADAAVRYATHTGGATSGACAASPCTLDVAINAADDGDEVVIGPGTYTLTNKLTPREIDIHGDRNHAWPRIVGASSLKDPMLTLDGGTLEHVSIKAAANKEALILKEGIVDGVSLDSANGDAATVYTSSEGTVIRNSVITSAGAVDSAALWLRDGSSRGSVEIRNVTAYATAGTGNGVHCDVADGSATVVSTIARGKGYDADLLPACKISYSNFRPANSTGVSAGVGNQSAEPIYADADYRPAAGSPTIDAGAFDALSSSPDPDGRPRVLGTAPDIGAYEYAPPATTGQPAPELPDDLKGVPLPKQGRSVVVGAARGTIRVRVPGSDRFVELAEAGRIPVGSVVDARRGRVRLATAIKGGVQAGLFWGAQFKTGQSRHGKGMTTLALRGGAYCPSATLAVASRAKKRKRRRSLWARDHGGLYRTRGNDSVATARGTRWFTRDGCRGTMTRVKQGAVAVRDVHRHKTVLVKAGHSYFARAPR